MAVEAGYGYESRYGIVESLPEKLASINPDVRWPDMTQGELVRTLKQGGVCSEPIDRNEETFYIRSRPYYWRFLVPSAESLHELEVVSFGVPNAYRPPLDSDFAAFDFEDMAIDKDLKAHKALSYDEATRCEPWIQDLALRVSMAGRRFFACIERRYPVGAAGPYSKGWSQLIFSSWLKQGSRLLRDMEGHTRYQHVPDEVRQAATIPEIDQYTVGRMLALAALYRTVELP